MSVRTIEQAEYTALIKRIKDLEKLLSLPTSMMVARQVKGVMSSPAYVLPANENSFTALDGMDITIDLDSPTVMVDVVITTSLTFSTGQLRWVIEVDGQIDYLSHLLFYNQTTARRAYSLLFTVIATPGRHRYRLMVSSTVAGTMTLSEKSRTMRVAGLIHNRRRFYNGRRT